MSCNVILENYNNAYFAGQTVSGRVECVFNSEKKVKNIHVRLKGKASVRWTESESYYDSSSKSTKTRQVTYWAEEEYFSIQINLVGTSADSMMIPAGRYVYPFSYILPQNLPSSFEGTHYRVRYKVKATVNRPWRFDYDAEAIYNIFMPMDLNLYPILRNPVKRSDDKTICCWCCASGPIEMTVSLAKTGFAINERLLANVYITNLSNVAVDEVKAKIIQLIDYTAHSPRHKTRTDTNTIVRSHNPGVGVHSENSFNIEMDIPSNTTIPNLIGCNIITNRYVFEVEAVISGPHTNLDLTFPISLGHLGFQVLGGPEVVAVAPTVTAQLLTSPSIDTGDFVMIDHMDPGVNPMPMPSNPGYPPEKPGYPPASPGYPTSGPGFPQPPGGYPPDGPGYPPAGSGYPPAGSGYPPAGPGYPPADPGYPPAGSGYPPASPGYPPAGSAYPPTPGNSGYPPGNPEKSSMHPPGGPTAPQADNPSAPPQMGGGFVNPPGSSFPAPPSYEQAMVTPEKQPL